MAFHFHENNFFSFYSPNKPSSHCNKWEMEWILKAFKYSGTTTFAFTKNSFSNIKPKSSKGILSKFIAHFHPSNCIVTSLTKPCVFYTSLLMTLDCLSSLHSYMPNLVALLLITKLWVTLLSTMAIIFWPLILISMYISPL